MSEPSPKTTLYFGPVRFAGLLLLLILVSFPDVLLRGNNFYIRDFSLFGYPLAYYHRESFWRGEVPLWNPLNNYGVPFLAQWNTLVLYPFSLIYLLLPMPWAVSLFCLAHFFLGGLGMYYLARRWTGSDLAASFAGIAFVFNGFSLNCLAWPNNIAAWGWMPWVILLAERAWSSGGKSVVYAALAGATQMLAGAPELTVFTWVLVAVFWSYELLSRPKYKHTQRMVVLMILVGALAAAQLLPFLDLLRHSDRDAGVGVGTWMMPALGWLNFFAPTFGCVKTNAGIFLQTGQYWTTSYYIGGIVVVIALLGAAIVRDRRAWLLLIITLSAIALAMGENGLAYPAFRKIFPQLGFMRFPIKLIVPALFALPLLAALCLGELEKRASLDSRARSIFLGSWLFAVCAIVLAIWISQRNSEPPEGIGSNALVRLVLLTSMALCVWKIFALQTNRHRIILHLVLLSLLWIDFITHVPRQNPSIAPMVYSPGLAAQQLKPPVQAPSRLMLSYNSRYRQHMHGLRDPVSDLLGRRLGFYANNNLLDNVAKCDGFLSLYLRESSELNRQITESENVPQKLLDYLAISHVSNTTNLLDWDFRSTSLPMVLLGAKPIFLPEPQIREKLFDPGFDPRQVVYLSITNQNKVTARESFIGNISQFQFTPQRLDFETATHSPAIVTVAQSYHHFWKAYVDEKPVPLWRANFAFQALEVPAGQHRVKLVYEDTSFQLGAVISIMTLLGCGLFCYRNRAAENAHSTKHS